jgi:plasmid maintenance system antidote protein VapI
VQAKRDAEMNAKNLEMKDIKNTFEAEARRLEDIIHNKDRVNEALGLELRKEKEKSIALQRNYDLEIGRLVNEKDHILSDFAMVND